MKNLRLILFFISGACTLIIIGCIGEPHFTKYLPIKINILLSQPIDKDEFKNNITTIYSPIKSSQKEDTAYLTFESYLRLYRFDLDSKGKLIDIKCNEEQTKELLGSESLESKTKNIKQILEEISLPEDLISFETLKDNNQIFESILSSIVEGNYYIFISNNNFTDTLYKGIRVFNKIEDLKQRISLDADNGVSNFFVIYKPNLEVTKIKHEDTKEKEFQKLLNEGNYYFYTIKDCVKAKEKYAKALKIKPNDKIILRMLDKKCSLSEGQVIPEATTKSVDCPKNLDATINFDEESGILYCAVNPVDIRYKYHLQIAQDINFREIMVNNVELGQISRFPTNAEQKQIFSKENPFNKSSTIKSWINLYFRYWISCDSEIYYSKVYGPLKYACKENTKDGLCKLQLVK